MRLLAADEMALQHIAFYAPLKSPNHPVPSGDRTMAQGIVAALQDISPETTVELVSELRSWDGKGDPKSQEEIAAGAQTEIARISTDGNARKWQVWVTYHNYYKAPDLIGPEVSRRLGIPYVIVEASRSRKRLRGPWANFADIAEQACDTADCIFYMTERDRPGLEQGRPKGQVLYKLRPFLNRSDLPSIAAGLTGEPVLLAVGMLRRGDKCESYRQLANALALVTTPKWTLRIIGDGPAAPDIKSLFSDFGPQAEFLGLLKPAEVMKQMAQADVFVWPGVNEAFGMVYLEAQAVGLVVVAENRLGVRDVVGPTGLLVEPDDAPAFAAAIDMVLTSRERPDVVRQTTRDYISRNHLRPAATALFAIELNRLLKGTA